MKRKSLTVISLKFFLFLLINTFKYTQTIRIVVTQSSLVLSNYATDQLQQDMARDKLVDEGKMTPAEAEDAAEEWETVGSINCCVFVLTGVAVYL